MIAYNNPYLEEFSDLDSNQFGYFSKRHEMVFKYAWAIPDCEILEQIAKNAPKIVEIGAGTGYWAAMLDQFGVEVHAYDRAPHHNSQADGCYFPIDEGGPECAANHPDCALFLCWPPYDTSMALDALKAYQGDTLIYIGEGMSGCTANNAFHAALGESEWRYNDETGDCVEIFHDSEWELIEEIDIPQWEGIYDSAKIYRRK